MLGKMSDDILKYFLVFQENRIRSYFTRENKKNIICLSLAEFANSMVSVNGNRFFPYRVDPFSRGDWCTGKENMKSQSCFHCQNGGKHTRYMQSSL